MGREKDRLMEEDDQGWRFSPELWVCSRCLKDPSLRQLVKGDASGHECSFCGRKTRLPSTIPFDELMETIAGGVFGHYNHADAEGMPWDREEDGYLFSTQDTDDLVRVTLDPSDNDEVLEAIIDSLGDHQWCQRHYLSLDEGQRFRFGWDEFCQTIKHERRFFFQATPTSPHEEAIPVAHMLSAIGDLVRNYGLVTTLPAATVLCRTRVHGPDEECTTTSTLGPPPPECTSASRMSPAGISMLYVASDETTALAETRGQRRKKKRLTTASWTTTRPLTLLNLTRLPTTPSIYESDAATHHQIGFLHDFVKDLAKPIKPDGREHIEYVPTQVLTEYFRHEYTTGDGQRLDGIQYQSAKRRRGSCYVLFLSPEDLDPDNPFQSEPPPLTLDTTSIHTWTPRRRNAT